MHNFRNYWRFRWLVLKDSFQTAGSTLRKRIVEEGIAAVFSGVVGAAVSYARERPSDLDGIVGTFLDGVYTTFAVIAIIVVSVFFYRLFTGSYRLWLQAGGKLPEQDVTEIRPRMVQEIQEGKNQEQFDIKEKIEILERKNSAGLSPLDIESKDRQLTELKTRAAELEEELDIPVSAGAAARLFYRRLSAENVNMPLINAVGHSPDWELFLADYISRNSGVLMYAYHPTDDEILYRVSKKDVHKCTLVNTGKGEFDLLSKSGVLKYRQLHFKRNTLTPFLHKVARHEQR